ncbi:zinc finger CCHC domain-containing protein 8 homolog [Topomyia yanbarensis]|uniref:zinc finger CCHC domain-containing protein 8 homolog n=1 Tax=Topomyia yanbarensis TaxID=2498891 RepID=UPI00273B0B25|nr:zinc finger CCHC domain-containing protein 8 homolog [Topomyia yanbarensis]
MGSKRKAEDEILEIRSDDDDDDSDVQIQEKPIPIVTVYDDDEILSLKAEAANSSSVSIDQPLELETAPPPPIISMPSDGQTEESEVNPDQQSPQPSEEKDESLLLSMKFRDLELFQLFKGSLTEYLRTTFQLKLAGQEVDVIHHAESASIQVLMKKTEMAPSPPQECVTSMQECVVEPEKIDTANDQDDGIFVIDSTPAKNAKGGPIIPSYKKALQKVLDNSPTALPTDSATKKPKPRQLCWNCEGDHGLRDCTEPRNFARISKMKQEFMKRTDRYHVDLEQKYGHIVPGRLTDGLRQALGLGKRDLPMHIYRMRMFGYPPGWLEEAKVTHSGLQLFDSDGTPVLDSDESEGEIDIVKMKYDVRKIISFPGFNTSAGKEFFDDSKFFGVPPRLEHQSREEMIKNLEGTLVQGYRRKKLRLAGYGQSTKGQQSADMDVDNTENMEDGFETIDVVGRCDESVRDGMISSLPSVNGSTIPPVAQEMDDEPEEGEVNEEGEEVGLDKSREPNEAALSDRLTSVVSNGNEMCEPDDSVIVMEDETDIICLDDTRAESPSLDELRKKQLELLKQLENQSPCVPNSADVTHEDSLLDDVLMAERLAEEQEANTSAPPTPTPPTISGAPVLPIFANFVFPVPLISAIPVPPPPPPAPEEPCKERPPEPEFLNLDEIKMSKIPFIDDPGSMGLKKMSLGTPILTAFSPFNSLPCGEAFSKGVSDVINFENLPNSTGKYERMKSLLIKVRNVISTNHGETEDESR